MGSVIRIGALLGWLAVAGMAAAEAPLLRVEAGEGLEGVANGIRANGAAAVARVAPLVGDVDAGQPILVLVSPEHSLLAKSAPEWISGYAMPEQNLIVLFPARAQRYPIDGMDELLRHELAHILIHRVARNQPVPRWFDEGLSTIAGGTWGMNDRGMLTLAMVRGGEASLRRVDEMFGGEPPVVERAYAISGAVVQHILEHDGRDTPAKILARVGAGVPFDSAVIVVTGRSVGQIEHDFFIRATFWNRWVPWITSSVVLWALITLLATWAMTSKMKRLRAELAASETADEHDEHCDDESVPDRRGGE